MLWSEINTIVSDLTDADTTAFPTATRLIYANQAQAEVAGDILSADGTWQWDDTNYTNLPIGKANLADDQQDYSFDDEMLYVERVSVLNSDGNYMLLDPIDMREVNEDRDEYLKTKGLPAEYDVQGRSIFLFPPPDANDVTTTNGLKVEFKRKTKDITSFDSSSPGFIATEHMILPYKIALPYIDKYHKDRVGTFVQRIQEHRQRIQKHYARRHVDDRPIITTKKNLFV